METSGRRTLQQDQELTKALPSGQGPAKVHSQVDVDAFAIFLLARLFRYST
jgi:hypothetical protein